MIFIAWHLGLGDAIACSAIVNKLSNDYLVTIPCWEHNKISVESFFTGNHKVHIMVVENDRLLQEDSVTGNYYNRVLRLGHYNKDLPQLPGEDFVQWFYRQAGMTMEDKERYCPIKEAINSDHQVDMPKKGISFIHQDNERGFIINKPNIEYVMPENIGGSILKYCSALQEAKEIHCIDSSFLHLVECLPVKGKKFYHKYARPESTDYKYLKNWEVIE